MTIPKILPVLVTVALLLGFSQPENYSQVLLNDDFAQLPSGLISTNEGAHTEYHFMPLLVPHGNWQVSSFYHDKLSARAWRVMAHAGKQVMAQTTNYPIAYTHPMIIAGDSLWQDYRATVRFAPQDTAQSGLMFRYRNSRCYYFFGVKNKKAFIKLVRHATAFRKPYEKILAEKPFVGATGQYLTATVTVEGPRITATLDGTLTLQATDSTYARGKVGLMADAPTYYAIVRVTATPVGEKAYRKQVNYYQQQENRLIATNPKMVLWKKFTTQGFGVGRNLRFGDLDGDGKPDVLIGQVVHHGPSDSNSELSCLTAMTFDGKKLWQTGQPDAWKNHLTNDVAFQIHDLDGDGTSEVIYCMNNEIIVAEGSTGKIKYKAPTPRLPTNASIGGNAPILGDCLYFADFRGTGHDRDIIIKDRYRYYWALDDKLNILWQGQRNTGHYPFAYDIDGDGKDELAIGYSLLGPDGKEIFSLDKDLKDHADGVAIVQYKPGGPLTMLNAASDEGMFFTDTRGNVLKHHYIGHVQNPSVANFRDDLPGLESVSINFWGNQGIIHFYDADGRIYHDSEPVQHGSMMLPVNWTGGSEEFFVLSANVEQGGLFDGWGRRVVAFPNDGHPDLCNAVLDLTGDGREEIVVWDAQEIWVYTQADNPKKGRLYQPTKNPLYNYSNYQTTVSLPSWSDAKSTSSKAVEK